MMACTVYTQYITFYYVTYMLCYFYIYMIYIILYIILYIGEKSIFLVPGDHNSPRPRETLENVIIFLIHVLQIPDEWLAGNDSISSSNVYNKLPWYIQSRSRAVTQSQSQSIHHPRYIQDTHYVSHITTTLLPLYAFTILILILYAISLCICHPPVDPGPKYRHDPAATGRGKE